MFSVRWGPLAEKPADAWTAATVAAGVDKKPHDPRRDGQTTFRQAAVEHFAHIMEVTGTESTVNGYHAIYVQGYVKK